MIEAFLLAYDWGLFAVSPFKCKIFDKKWPRRLKHDTYFTIFRRVQQVFRAYSVINNYLLEYFNLLMPIGNEMVTHT